MIRKTVSLTLCLSGICVIVTSIVLFVGPPTHVGHFSDWRMLGLSKCQWNVLHIMTGLLFVLAIPLHIYYNWKPVIAYLKNSQRKFVLLTRPFVISLLITAYICVGSLQNWPPMDLIINGVKTIKIAHVRKYGTPPFGPAEKAPLRSIIMYMGWDVDESINALRREGFVVDPANHTLQQAAHINNISTADVLEIMKKAAEN